VTWGAPDACSRPPGGHAAGGVRTPAARTLALRELEAMDMSSVTPLLHSKVESGFNRDEGPPFATQARSGANSSTLWVPRPSTPPGYGSGRSGPCFRRLNERKRRAPIRASILTQLVEIDLARRPTDEQLADHGERHRTGRRSF